jgi:diguanylate cyclase (GGDEF)-like protein
MNPTTVRGSMTLRLLATLFSVTVAVVLIGGLLMSLQLRDMLGTLRQDRINGITRGYGRELSARLDAVQSYVHALSTDAGSPGGLRQQLLRSTMVAGVTVVPANSAAASQRPDAAVPVLGTEEIDLLASGQTVLATGRDARGLVSVYLARQLSTPQGPQIAYFELARRWLWQQSADSVRLRLAINVLDDQGQMLSGSRVLPARVTSELLGMAVPMGREELAVGPLFDWRDAGLAMQSAAVKIDPQSLQLRGQEAWIIIGSMSPSDFALLPLLESMLPWLLLALALALALGTIYLRQRWEPALQQMLDALEEWRAGRFVATSAGTAGDLPRLLIQAFNRVAPTLASRVAALTSLREIDRLLLEAKEIEQCLEPVLVRACALIGADGAAITLVDPDAPGHGRVLAVSREGNTRSVQRVALDTNALETLSEAATGVLVRRGEPEHHALLEPLGELGGELFRIWRVTAQGRVVAVLTASYGSQPAAAELATYGGECAAVLALALSNSVREEQLYRQAHFDSLTSLPNRLLFRDRLSQEIAISTDGSRRGALLYVDLDHFKKINDSAGHIGGDQLLTIVAQRLRACVKDGDTVARLGGDEFTVILRDIDKPEAVREIAERIIESLQRPVYIAGRDYKVLASIGITVFPDDGSAIDELLRHADVAMYRAKERGRSQAVFFDTSMVAPPTTGVGASGLFRALRRREFALFYQPVFGLREGELMGVEALLRWQPPRSEMRFPHDFVPAAEESGLIVELGGWAIETACAQFAEWSARGIAPPRLSVNVSAQQLRAPEFSRQLKRALERAGMAASRLELEITEAACVEDEARAALQQVAELGVRLSLDNFGTGYSSLNHLRQVPLQAVKLDRSFVVDVTVGGQAALTRTLIDMAHALGREVIAGGVETLEQLDALREQGCDAAQGFGLAPPSSAETMSELLQVRDRRLAAPSQRQPAEPSVPALSI